MSTFKLQIDTGNDAFQDGNKRAEIIRILREVALRIEEGTDMKTFRNLRDYNGNIVGTFALKEKFQ